MMKGLLRSPLLPLAVLAALLALLATGALADNIDPKNTGAKYAWGENVGWINAKPANCSGCGATVWSNKLTGYMWGENIGWINLNCQNDGSCAGGAGNWGVTNDGAGHLSGYAWGENVGWISFSCANRNTCASVNYGVAVNGTTGSFTGYAWGENIGWLNFNCTNDSSCGSVQYQVQAGGCTAAKVTPWTVPLFDDDCDGFTTAIEQFVGTDPGLSCGTNSWPPDFNNSGKVDITDVLLIKPHFASTTGQPAYSQRFDLTADGNINLVDVLKLKPVFGYSCVP